MRRKSVARTRDDARWIVATAFALLVLAAGGAMADAGPRGIADMLHSRGYYNIRIVDSDRDEYEVVACKGEWRYELEVKRSGRIDDTDREGRCDPMHYGGYYPGNVGVDVPFAGVNVNRGEVDVDAPLTGVHVGKNGVHVRAPFVDLHVPRR